MRESLPKNDCVHIHRWPDVHLYFLLLFNVDPVFLCINDFFFCDVQDLCVVCQLFVDSFFCSINKHMQSRVFATPHQYKEEKKHQNKIKRKQLL